MSNRTPRAIVLGSVQDGGFPHLGCACEACLSAVGDPRRARRVACLGLITRGGVAVIDATPDLPAQLRELARCAGQSFDTPPRALLLTHLHAGHVAGLPLFGREAWAATGTPLWATEANLHFLESQEPLARLFREGHLSPQVLHPGWDTALDDLMIQAIPVPHRSEAGDTVGFRIEGPERSLFYAPDLDALTPDTIAQVRAADVAILDGTFFRRSELNRDDSNAVPHPAIADSLPVLAGIDTEIRFTHMNHTNPVLDPDSPDRRAVEGMGMRISEDGDEVILG
ncbi:MAG: MBL fold metallo-hydrolase [Gemmatimonadota bacterium]|nr:MBL fold metallo-hydrolase [Gemmatimonadota bacterium]MDP6803017.1 MBL fold metallo-hydrolase [Gemmatimonadota bacterium]MDP7032280.1 MBL fold metallo-hydrolase [Gemmatimonadota bacterium]